MLFKLLHGFKGYWSGSAAVSRDIQSCISLPGIHTKSFPPRTFIVHPQLQVTLFIQAAVTPQDLQKSPAKQNPLTVAPQGSQTQSQIPL